MAIIDDKIVSFVSTISDLPDQPNAIDGMTAIEVKAMFDQNPEALRSSLGGLIDNLLSTTSGDSGADNIGITTISGISGSTVQSVMSGIKSYADTLDTAQSGNLTAHINNVSNPHVVTKTQVGLGSADNTADTDKPVSTATQTALNLKVDKTTTINGYDLSVNRTLTTADIADSSNKRYVTDSNIVVIGNTSNTNTGDETAQRIGTLINNASQKTIPANSDMVGLMDSEDSNTLKKLSWFNLKNVLATAYDTLYVPLTRTINSKSLSNNITLTTADIADSSNKRYVTDANLTLIGNTSNTNTGDETVARIGALINNATEKTSPVDADMIGLMDSADSNTLKKLSWLNVQNALSSVLVGIEDGGSASTSSFLASYDGGTSSTTAFDFDSSGARAIGY